MITPGEFRALVALRAKQGEFMALEALDDSAHVRNLQPLIEFDAAGKKPADQLDAIEAAVRRLHKLGRHVMLDASGVEHSTSFGGGPAGALGELADRLSHPGDLFDEQDPIPFIPVVRHDAPGHLVAMVGRLCQELGLGGALRVRTMKVNRAHWESALRQLGVETVDLDLIIDLQYLPEVTTQVTDRVATAIGVLAEFGRFRSTSLLSGSIPPQLTHTSAREQPRAEERLWESLVRDGVARLRLADYGVVHPLPRDPHPAKHVSLKYTCPDHWLYLRERVSGSSEETARSRIESPRSLALRAVCRHLVESDGFAGPDFSWGDRQISEAADGRGSGLGSPSRPVAFATSHHLAYLAARAAS
ncbi:hypothetical protein FNH05_19670 [Amycolatopsis rhizosphaerae]|uniref:T4 beta protein n=1 Tax=Amycolatopsis rhizosphaerae TaxID=2053003 RepID=A0A558CE71_9PSEU|nr:hypothetical protein [Amycolatopsis rhizosphaerae]TVT46962.1 hypothetical protein FNH05_19670 [Amycolatopsis rhizosphaerae]